MEQTARAWGTSPLGEQVEEGSCKGGIFVPVQTSGETWPPDVALAKGTAFPCLYDPYMKGEKYDG